MPVMRGRAGQMGNGAARRVRVLDGPDVLVVPPGQLTAG